MKYLQKQAMAEARKPERNNTSARVGETLCGIWGLVW